MTRIYRFAIATFLGMVWAATGFCAEIVIPAKVEATAKSEREQKVNRFLFLFDLPTGLSDTRVDRAQLRINVDRSASGSDAIQLRILPVREDWTGAVRSTLSETPTADDSAGISWVIQKEDSGLVVVDVQPIVEDWLRSRYPNRGILIMPLENSEENMTLREYAGKESFELAELIIRYRPQGRDSKLASR